ncbi:hypothetical protein [Hyalangium versicolor]|uniref:hypothetical protein n=1 Tax=Hyalangium versicolor TaxID=2861190 RepID=UPI001CCF88AA|nr:hypothetical protein [Hyalangium versicolor]
MWIRGCLCAAMLLMVGCESGKEGAQGPQGERGAAGPAGAQGPQGERGAPGEPGRCNDLVFVDATGHVAAPVCAPYIVDAQGYIWKINRETGSFAVEDGSGESPYDTNDLTSLVSFESEDCSGQGYVEIFLVPPRMPFIAHGKYRVRPDSSTSSQRTFRSRWGDDGTCDAYHGAPSEIAFPLPPEQELTPPTAFQGPLHIERRQ